MSKRLTAERLIGFMQSTWRPTTEPFRKFHLDAVRGAGVTIASAETAAAP